VGGVGVRNVNYFQTLVRGFSKTFGDIHLGLQKYPARVPGPTRRFRLQASSILHDMQ
jgi:hypothetical protein